MERKNITVDHRTDLWRKVEQQGVLDSGHFRRSRIRHSMVEVGLFGRYRRAGRRHWAQLARPLVRLLNFVAAYGGGARVSRSWLRSAGGAAGQR